MAGRIFSTKWLLTRYPLTIIFFNARALAAGASYSINTALYTTSKYDQMGIDIYI